jgi:hypothetical protein
MYVLNWHLNGWEIEPTLDPLSNETLFHLSEYTNSKSNRQWAYFVNPPATILRLLIHPNMLHCDNFLNTCSITKKPMLSFSNSMQQFMIRAIVLCYLKISGDGIVNGIVASYQKPLKEPNPHTEGNWGGGAFRVHCL